MTMKKINILLALVASVLFGLTSCEDNLDIQQHSVSSYDTYYQTDDEAEEGIVHCYVMMRTLYTGFNNDIQFVKEHLSDNIWSGGGNHYDGNYYQLADYTFSSDYAAISNIYTNLYNLIYATNVVIEKVKGGTEIQNRAIAEAKVFRAFANFQLVTLWGTAPLVKHTLSESEYMQPNSTPDSLWAAVETDLKEAINSGALTQKASVNQPTARVTKQFAQAMLGKAQLFQKKYAEAARTLDEVINSKLYILNPDLSNQGTPDGDNSVESLFEVNLPFDTNNRNENNNFRWIGAGLRAEKYSYTDGSPLCRATWGYQQPRKDLYDAFVKVEGKDGYRLNNTILTLDQLKEKLGATPIVEITDNEGYFNYKYRILAKYFANYFYANNVRVMKYNEVLLLAAEAHLQAGDAATAINYINEIRTRAKAPQLVAIDMETIKTESRLELYGEGQRYENLVRWGDAVKVLGHNGESNPALQTDGTVKWTSYNKAGECGFKERNYLWPFPATEIQVNKNLKQNEGW